MFHVKQLVPQRTMSSGVASAAPIGALGSDTLVGDETAPLSS
jgi:hypothetical protein